MDEIEVVLSVLGGKLEKEVIELLQEEKLLKNAEFVPVVMFRGD